jgi:DMSO reductase anchor subunit
MRRFRKLTALAVVLPLGGIAAGLAGPLLVAVGLVFGGELIGRYLFYVTVVPLDMPGSFYRSMA